MSASETQLDANWCHIRETLTLLQLSTAKIRSSMQDGDKSISELSQTLGSISESANEIRSASQDGSETINSLADSITANVQQGVVACQFHDRVTQRMDHVTDALKQLGDLINSPIDSIDPDNWLNLQDKIRNSYTMDSEKIMFEHIMMGASVEEALEIYRHHFESAPVDDTDDDMELF